MDLSLAERVASIEAIIKEYFIENKVKSYREKITAKLLSDLTGMSLTQSRRYILILEATPELKQAIATGKLENIKLIELILSIENAEHQKKLLDADLSNLSYDAIIKLKNEIESGDVKNKVIVGRKQLHVSLGKVKPSIAKIIFDSLVTSNIIKKSIIEQLITISDNVQWNNNKSVEGSFKKLISLIAQET
jgi:ParB family chromosome partitioning protein